MNVCETSLRSHDWIFHALWTTIGKSPIPAFSVLIPLTIIFKDGIPIRAISSESDSRALKRLLFDVPSDFLSIQDDRSLRGEKNKPFRLLKHYLSEFQQQHKYDLNQDIEEPFLCKVFYVDGEREDISSQTFDILIRNESWRSQILMIQGFIPQISSHKGIYSTEKKIRSKLDEYAEASDQVTRAIAKFAEKAYRVSASEILMSNLSSEGVNLMVKELIGRFALDPFGKLFFLYPENTLVELQGTATREVEDTISIERSAREASAAQTVLSELRTLLMHAKKRGLASRESFQHFDLKNNGFVDVHLLIDGLARLGIGVTFPVGQSVLRSIGGVSSSFFTFNDFEKFLAEPADLRVFAADTFEMNQSSIFSSSGTSKKSSKTSKSLNPLQKKQATPQDPTILFDLQSSQQQSWVDSSVLDVPPSLKGSPHSLSDSSFENPPSNVSLPLPLPEDSYRVQTPRSKQTDLPRWATQRQHRALRELRKSQEKYNLKNTSAESKGSDSPSISHGPSISSAPANLKSIALEITQSKLENSDSCLDEVLHVDQGVIMTYRILLGRDLSPSELSDSIKYKRRLERRQKNLAQLRNSKQKPLQGGSESTNNPSDPHLRQSADSIDSFDEEEEESEPILDGESPSPDSPKPLRPSPLSTSLETKNKDEDQSSLPSPSHRSEESEALKQDLNANRDVSFTLIIVPDLFHTLDTLQSLFQPLLLKYPEARIILVGLPGLPNTVWPSDWVLNSELHSKCLAKLLHFLRSNDKLNDDPGEPFLVLGVGLGTHSLSRFLVNLLPGLPWMEEVLKGVVLVNPVMKFQKQLKTLCRNLYQSMSVASFEELNELIVSLHLWDQYMQIESRTKALEKFWSTRTTLNPSDPSLARPGNYFPGIKELLKGLLLTPDEFDGAQVLATDLPILVIQSTENVFLDPRSVASLFQKESLPPERNLVDHLVDSLDKQSVHLSWLKAGHEVVQERTPFFLTLLAQLGLMCGNETSRDQIRAVVHQKEALSRGHGTMEEDIFDVLALAEKRKKKKEEDRLEAAKAEFQALLAKKEHKKKLKEEKMKKLEKEKQEKEMEARKFREIEEQQERERKLEEEALKRSEEAKQKAVQDELDAQANEAKRQRLQFEKEKRIKLAEEKARRELKEARRVELEYLYEQEREEKELKAESKEREKMRFEDLRSYHAAVYMKETLLAQKFAIEAHEKQEELQRLRREEALKKVEEELGRQRAQRVEERRKQAEEVVRKILSEELVLEGKREGGYELPAGTTDLKNVNADYVLMVSYRIIKDFLECKHRYVESMKRQLLVEEKFQLFKKQCFILETDIQGLRQAVRLLSSNPMVAGSEKNAQAELEVLSGTISQKETSLVEMSSLKKARERQLDSCNKSVQSLKGVYNELNEALLQRIRELNQMEVDLTAKIRKLRMDKEHQIVERDKLRVQEIICQARIDNVQHEIDRIKDHHKEYVDTVVWVEGVLQRCRTEDLKMHLSNELQIYYEKLRKLKDSLSTYRQEVLDTTEDISKSNRDLDKISSASKVLQRSHTKINAISVSTILTSLVKQHETAEKVDRFQAGNMDVVKMAKVLGADSLADKVRLKPHELRTKEERFFLGLDLVMFPEKYLHISKFESEQMQFDDDYHCELSKSELLRIDKLPEQISLAMPFLHSLKEIEIHRVLMKFGKCKDEDYYRMKDFLSASSPSEGSNKTDDSSSITSTTTITTKPGEHGAPMISSKDLQDAETIHEILLREARRDRVRAMGEGDEMTADQREWLQLDHILSPHLFGKDERTFETLRERNFDKELSSSNVELQEMDRITKRKITTEQLEAEEKEKEEKRRKNIQGTTKQGDLYENLRERYAEGEVVFDYSWRCPFNRAQLIEIFESPSDPKTEDEWKVKRLMNLYYVSDFESILGNSRLKLLHEISRDVSGVVKRAKRRERRENFQSAKQKEEERKKVIEKMKEQAQASKKKPRSKSPNKKKKTSTSANASGSESESEPSGIVFPVERSALAPSDLDSRSIVSELSALEQDPSLIEGNDNDDDNITLSTLDEPEPEIKRVWGSWEAVHPASAGATSQSKFFMVSGFDPSRDHPAFYAVKDDDEAMKWAVKDPLGLDGLDLNLPQGQDLLDLGLKSLTSDAGTDLNPKKNDKSGQISIQNNPHSKWFIVESPSDLAKQDVRKVRHKIVLLCQPERMNLLEVKDITIQSRQSRSHRFELPDSDNMRALSITVSVVYQGGFTGKGYRLGRLAVALFRLPDESARSQAPIPIPVGYCPYRLLSTNLPEQLGRTVILHQPKVQPIPHGTFQIVIGAASTTKYSIEVTCKYSKLALPIVDKEVIRAKEMQQRLPNCLLELEALDESLRLVERKLIVCQKMISEAEIESDRCKNTMLALQKKLRLDDEAMIMFEDERRECLREIGILEVEFAQWATAFGSRNKEKEDIKDGIDMMHKFQRERQKEKRQLKEDLEKLRKELPACICALRNYEEAVNVAASLNTQLEGQGAALQLAAGETTGPVISTPAMDLRRRYRRDGFNMLTLEEQQWLMLDMALNPAKYEWLREQEEEEAAARAAQGKMPKVKRYSAAVEAYRLQKVEIEKILTSSFQMLNRREVLVRKLLIKFHDNSDVIRREYSVVSYGFDPNLAERTRAKNQKAYSREEAEWASIDRILHPEIWSFISNEGKGFGLPDPGAKDADAGSLTRFDSSRPTTALQPNNQKKPAEANSNLHKQLNSNQQSAINTIGRLLGQQESLGVDADSLIDGRGLDLAKLVSTAHGKNTSKIDSKALWQCVWDRETILHVWKLNRTQLKSDEERLVYRLLHKYNGTYSAYITALAEKTAKTEKSLGFKVRWEAKGKLIPTDPDMRAKQLLREVDRATYSKSEYMNSDVLHGQDQRFPTKVLRIHLEEALDRLLSDQIKERERAEIMRVDTDSEATGSEEDELSDEGEGEIAERNLLAKIKERAKKRAKLRKRLTQPTEEEQVLKAKRVLTKNKTGAALAEAILQNQLGPGGCLACRSNPCRWRPTVDVDACEDRKKILDKELERVRNDKESIVFESTVVLSAQLGGTTAFRRVDLLDELAYEQRELDRRIHLHFIDKELHDSFATRKEYIQVKHLHGYSMMLWTNNARVALSSRQSRLVAMEVAKEAVDDILDWMLEGWYFGERQSSFNVLGYVPSIKPDGKIRSGQDQIKSVGEVVKKMKKRADLKKQGVVTGESMKGTMQEKSLEIEETSQQRIRDLKVARDGNVHEHNLNETETTLRFGLFLLTVMYFRAMTYLRREKASWGGEDDELSLNKKKDPSRTMTLERMRMLEEESRVSRRRKKIEFAIAKAKVGEQRKYEREAAERREMALRLHTVVKRQKLELEAVNVIQRVFRGHIGRKVARRWALKRAELGAMESLLGAAAVSIQRYYRGYMGRKDAVAKRKQMAHFIALMRAQESADDEVLYWQTHPWSRFKRNQTEWLKKKLYKDKNLKVMGGNRFEGEVPDDLLGIEENEDFDKFEEDEEAVGAEEEGEGVDLDDRRRKGRPEGNAEDFLVFGEDGEGYGNGASPESSTIDRTQDQNN